MTVPAETVGKKHRPVLLQLTPAHVMLRHQNVAILVTSRVSVPGGDCWQEAQTCNTPNTAGYCNAVSTNCGTTCSSDTDCPGGSCALTMPDCNTPSTTGYCNAASDNCGSACSTPDECPNGDCKTARESCGPVTGHVIGTYLGALPYGVSPPPLSDVPADVNFVLLGFAKDVSYNGKFVPFSEWTRLGVTNAAITQDKVNNPNRKYMVSLGGAADYGGTFGIAGGLSVNQWLDEAYASIKTMVDDLNADGVDVQASVVFYVLSPIYT